MVKLRRSSMPVYCGGAAANSAAGFDSPHPTAHQRRHVRRFFVLAPWRAVCGSRKARRSVGRSVNRAPSATLFDSKGADSNQPTESVMTETAAEARRLREDRVIYRASKILQRRWEELEIKPAFDDYCQSMEYFRFLLAGHENERIVCASLDARHRLLAVDTVAIGGILDCAIYPREFARVAMEHGAAAVIVAHNHPSGDATPSYADVRATEAIAAALAVLDIRLLDHVVVGTGGSSSMAAMNMMSMRDFTAQAQRQKRKNAARKGAETRRRRAAAAMVAE